MFQNKNQNNDPESEKTILSQENDLRLKDIPIHTMKKDLEEMRHPEAAKDKEEALAQSVSHEKLTDAQKGSPFLDFSPEKNQPPAPVSRPETPKNEPRDSRISFSETRPELKKPTKTSRKAVVPKTVSHVNYRKIFAVIVIILTAAILAGGGYYFWSTRQKPADVVVMPAPDLKIISQPENLPTFNVDGPNNLTVDMSGADGVGAKETLKKYADDVSASKINTPVEFAVIDTDNNPVTFRNFAKKIKMAFSPALAANLDEPFNLFVYNDGAVTRLGLVVDSKNPLRLKALMLAEEKTLIKKLEPLFLATDYTLAIKSFSSGTHNDTAIRYANITSPEDLSVDYAISGNKLVIGTTKMTLRSILDYSTPKPATDSQTD